MTEEPRDEPFDYDAELVRYQPRLRAAAEIGPRDRVLDVGCGAGSTTREAAESAVRGEALGLDVSARMIAAARRLSEREGLRNVRFVQADAQIHPFPSQHFSVGISRFGTMFFADPDAAFANLARALSPGARLVQLVWQDGRYQEWREVIQSALAAGRTMPAPPSDEPFSLADPAALRALLTRAGFTQIQLSEVREPVYYGTDTEAACSTARGLRMTQDLLAGLDPSRAERALDRLRSALAAHRATDGVWLDSRAWLVAAHRP